MVLLGVPFSWAVSWVLLCQWIESSMFLRWQNSSCGHEKHQVLSRFSQKKCFRIFCWLSRLVFLFHGAKVGIFYQSHKFSVFPKNVEKAHAAIFQSLMCNVLSDSCMYGRKNSKCLILRRGVSPCFFRIE